MTPASQGEKSPGPMPSSTMAAPPMAQGRSVQRGRPPREGEPLTEERQVKFAESMMTQMQSISRETGISVAEFIRRAVGEKIHGQGISIDRSQDGTNQFRAKFLTKAPCGDWREALESGSDYVLSQDVADSLEAREGDIVVMADGESMDGAGIPDGALILMRPLANHARPSRGEIALVQITNSQGECESTIKRWMKSGPTPADVKLVDGDDEPFPLPDDAQDVRAIAVARGLITRI